jgi:hypothetical protein
MDSKDFMSMIGGVFLFFLLLAGGFAMMGNFSMQEALWISFQVVIFILVIWGLMAIVGGTLVGVGSLFDIKNHPFLTMIGSIIGTTLIFSGIIGFFIGYNEMTFKGFLNITALVGGALVVGLLAFFS